MDIIYIYPFLECLNTKPIIKNKRLNNGVIFVLYCIISVMSTGDCFTPYYKSTFKNLDTNNIHVFYVVSMKTDKYQGDRYDENSTPYGVNDIL